MTCYYVDLLFSKNLERQQQLHDWMELSAYMLPCGVCEYHFKKFMRDNPLPPVAEFDPQTCPYLRWSIRAHNAVRKRQNKPLADEDEVVASYKSGTIYGLAEYRNLPTNTTSKTPSKTPSKATSKLKQSSLYKDETVPSSSSETPDVYFITTWVLAALLFGAIAAAVVFAMRSGKSAGKRRCHTNDASVSEMSV